MSTPAPTPAPAAKRLFVVEPDADDLRLLVALLSDVGAVEGYEDFTAARQGLRAMPPALLMTNLQLGAFNGIHFAHVVAPPTRVIVYADDLDPPLVVEALRAGAFIETRRRLPVVLPAYAAAPTLPPRDRRNPFSGDRRMAFRGGRRITDRALMAA